jgi:hypothetical protein
MADYYALIKKAVARLDLNAPRESRRALYERARVAQITQLRSISPVLSETEITCEQLELEDAIRRVEAEMAARESYACVPTLDDLVAAADRIGEPLAPSSRHSNAAQSKASVKASLPNPIVFHSTQRAETSTSMSVSGDATGRLVRFWRWRSHLPGKVAPLNAVR